MFKWAHAHTLQSISLCIVVDPDQLISYKASVTLRTED